MSEFLESLGLLLVVIIIAAFAAGINASIWRRWCTQGEFTVIDQKVYRCVSVNTK